MEPLPRTKFLVIALGVHELDWIREAAANERVEPADFIRTAALDAAFEQRKENLR